MPLRSREARMSTPTNYVVPIVVAGVVAFLMMTASRTAKRVEDADVLTYSPQFRFIARALWLFPVVIAVIALFSRLGPGDGAIVMALIAGSSAICLPLTLEVFRREIAIREAGVSQKSAWSKPMTLAWKDVREARWRGTGELELRPARGRAIRISPYLSGIDTLADALEQRLPHLPSAGKAAQRLRRHRI
jgi:hypothetical protein